MHWIFKPKPNPKEVEKIAKELSINKALASLLVQRGVNTFAKAKEFFRPSLSNLHNPFLMKDMDLAVARIELALNRNENILIYGDYDVDGTTATSLMYCYLKEQYPNVATYIPDRYQEGYGVSFQGVNFAYENNFSLIIALDCGIKAVDKVNYAKQKGIDFIICDHHKPGIEVPKAFAILNPKQKDCNYPYTELCGCGIGFKLAQALEQQKNYSIKNLIPYLDLVAIAIAADIVPITGENRVLAYYGLQVINSSPRNGVKALFYEMQKNQLSITDVVFIIAPRINAAGRIKHGNFAVSLLIETDFKTALQKAEQIEKFNSDRKKLDSSITKDALLQIEQNNEQHKFSTVVYNKNWHKGVIGIVASRLIKSYHRPTVVFTKSSEKLVGSARSVNDFDIYAALEKCSTFIEQFGGHKYAAGLSVSFEQYESFKSKFEQVVAQSIDKEYLIPQVLIDSELNLEDINPKFYRILKQMAPFGPQNMNPVFYTKNIKGNNTGKKVGADSSHLKLNITSQDCKKAYGAIGFELGNKIKKTHENFDIVYNISENTWNGITSIQLVLKDLK
ncbi:MAG: single-stranded-DNA-specific exonuclease RecJ [Tenacibaculum sp.]